MRRLSFGYQIPTVPEAHPRPPSVNYSREGKFPVTWSWRQYSVLPYVLMAWHLRRVRNLQARGPWILRYCPSLSCCNCICITRMKKALWRILRDYGRMNITFSRPRWPRGLRDGFTASRFLGLRVRIPLRHGCLSVVNVVCCQLEVSATGRSLVQRNPTECARACASLCVIRCYNKPLHFLWVGRRGKTKKERKKKEYYFLPVCDAVWYSRCVLKFWKIVLSLSAG
jgi:hypothetical protein